MSHELYILEKQGRKTPVMSDAEAEAKFLLSSQLKSITGMMMSPALEKRAEKGLNSVGLSYMSGQTQRYN
jgi:hypothetical protein